MERMLGEQREDTRAEDYNTRKCLLHKLECGGLDWRTVALVAAFAPDSKQGMYELNFVVYN